MHLYQQKKNQIEIENNDLLITAKSIIEQECDLKVHLIKLNAEKDAHKN